MGQAQNWLSSSSSWKEVERHVSSCLDCQSISDDPQLNHMVQRVERPGMSVFKTFFYDLWRKLAEC